MVEVEGVVCLALTASHDELPRPWGLLARVRSNSSIFESRSSIKSIFFSLRVEDTLRQYRTQPKCLVVSRAAQARASRLARPVAI